MQGSFLAKLNEDRMHGRRYAHLRRNQPSRGYMQHAAVWALRLLLRMGDCRRFHRQISDSEAFFEAVGLEEIKPECEPEELKRALGARLVELEDSLPADMGVLGQNIDLLGDALYLTDIERQVLAFVVVLHHVRWLENCADTLGRLDTRQVHEAIATALSLEESDVRKVFTGDATLVSAGILRVLRDNGDLESRLQLLSTFADILLMQQDNALAMLRPFFKPSVPATLCHEDYPHAANEWSLVARYLAAGVKDHKPGLNVLIYGLPGTGKTEFVRSITKELQLELLEVVAQDMDGDPLKSQQRLGAYLLTQRALQRMCQHVVLFDEVEDVFLNGSMEMFGARMERSSSVGKGFMNWALEQNPVPSFWLTNCIEGMDPAVLRRFDLIIEMPKPTRSIRKQMFSRYLGDITVTRSWLDNIAEHKDLMPATIERAAKVVRYIHPQTSEESERLLNEVLKGTLEAMGSSCTFARSPGVSLPYSLDYVNADVDLSSILEGVKLGREGRLCLYGPPGTGKTEFARHLAKVLDQPLLIKRASDLLDKYVGGTEKNIAGMFKEASQERAILLLDEADSFLRDRLLSQRSWEVTEVNELLTQMETFTGIFIASTNLMDNIDLAALRRFDFKVQFSYMKPNQRIALLQKATGESDQLPTSVLRRIQALDTLTPGDFAVAVRQAELRAKPLSADILLSVLEQECAIKLRGQHPFLGFTGIA